MLQTGFLFDANTESAKTYPGPKELSLVGKAADTGRQCGVLPA